MNVEARFYGFANGTVRVVEREIDREEVARNNALMRWADRVADKAVERHRAEGTLVTTTFAEALQSSGESNGIPEGSER